jgi:octanoyl-[GcvH]:protein N-octanoyltransferase
MFVDVLRGLGVDARLGAAPREYCPGAHSVNARGVAKLVGTAQRVVRNAWLFSSLVIVGDENRIQPVLAEVYRCLSQEFEMSSVGSLSREVPSLRVETVERTIIDAYAAVDRLEPAVVDLLTLDTARELLLKHQV